MKDQQSQQSKDFLDVLQRLKDAKGEDAVRQFLGSLTGEEKRKATEFITGATAVTPERTPEGVTRESQGEVQQYMEEEDKWYDPALTGVRTMGSGFYAAASLTAGMLDKASTKLSEIGEKITGIPKEKLRGGVFKTLEKDWEYYADKLQEKGIGGITGEVFKGIGGAAWDIPSIMAFGQYGLPIHGALTGASEGGLEGAVEGAITGALVHKSLGAIGLLPSKARLPAFAGFGFVTTPGGIEERVAGSLTWTVLGLSGGKRKVTVPEFMSAYPKIPWVKRDRQQVKVGELLAPTGVRKVQEGNERRARKILKELDPKLTDAEIKKGGGSMQVLDDIYTGMWKESITQTLESRKITKEQVLLGKLTPEEADFVNMLDMSIDTANKAGKRVGKKKLYNTMELCALEADVPLKDVLNNADAISEGLVRTRLSLSDMIKENKYLWRYLDKAEETVSRPAEVDAKTKANTQIVEKGIPLEIRPYTFPLPKGEKLELSYQQSEGTMPVFVHERVELFKNIIASNEPTLKRQVETRAWTGTLKNPIYTFEEYPIFKKTLYDPMKAAEDTIFRERSTTGNRVKAWTKILADAPAEYDKGIGRIDSKRITPKQSIERLANYAIAQQTNGVETLKAMGKKPVETLTAPERQIYNAIRADLEKIYNQINQARVISGRKPMPKVENYFTFFRNLETLRETGYNPIYESDVAKLHEKLSAVPFEFGKKRGKDILPADLRFFDVYKLYRDKAMKFIHKSPIIAKGEALMQDFPVSIPPYGEVFKGLKADRPILHSVVEGWLRHQVGGTQKATGMIGKRVSRALGSLNRNVAMWVLGWNFRSMFIQPTALRLSYMEIGGNWLAKGAAGYSFSEAKRNFIERESNVILSRMFDVHAAEIFEMQLEKNLRGKYKKYKAEFGGLSMKPLQALDLMAAKMTWYGAYLKGKAPKTFGRGEKMQRTGGLGKSEAEAKRYADDVVTKTQASAQPSDIAPLQRTPAGKAMSLFQTFVINEWNYLYKNVGGFGERVETGDMSLRQRAAQITRVVYASALINALYEGVLHLNSPYPAPMWKLYEDLKDDVPTGRILWNIAREMGEQIPVIGGTIRYSSAYRTSLPAIPQLTLDSITRLNSILIKPKLNQYDIDLVGKIIGIAGGGQVMKYIRRRKKGMTHVEAYIGMKPISKKQLRERDPKKAREMEIKERRRREKKAREKRQREREKARKKRR